MSRVIFILLGSAIAWVGLYTFLSGNAGPDVDPRLEPYVNQWKADMDAAGIHYEGGYNRIKQIAVYDLSHDLAGVSIKGIRVGVSPVEAKRGGCALKYIVYHELGHNVFNLDHSNDECSMMDRMAYTEADCFTGWNHLLEDYLKKCKEHEWEAY